MTTTNETKKMPERLIVRRKSLDGPEASSSVAIVIGEHVQDQEFAAELARRWNAQAELDSKLEFEWRRGYLLATANMMRMHDQSAIAEDMLRQLSPDGDINWSGIDPMEKKVLAPIAKEIRRKNAL